MPIFDFECDGCDAVFEDHLAAKLPEFCPECGAPVNVPVQPFMPIGIISSNVVRSDQLGIQLESNAQRRAFEKANPNLRAYSKGSPEERRLGDRIRNKAEKDAKRQGFKDHEDKVTTLRREKGKGAFEKPVAAKAKQG